MKELNRREFCGLCGVSALPFVLPHQGNRIPEGSGMVTRSNEFLTIGVSPDQKYGFIEDRRTGESWEWNFGDLQGAAEDIVRPIAYSPESITQRLRPLTVDSIRRHENGLELQCREFWGSFSCLISLEPARPEVVFSILPNLRKPFHMGAVRFPGSLAPSERVSPQWIDSQNGGRLHRKPESPFTIPADRGWMRFYGALGRQSAYLSILEPGFDAALELRSEDELKWSMNWLHIPRFGEIDQIRAQRMIFLPTPSYASAARSYREYSKRTGFYRSLQEKLRECPSLEKMFGAVLLQLGYLHDDEADYASAFRRLKKMGVDKAYVYPTGYFNLNGGNELYPGYPWIDLGQETLHEISRLGYVHAPWLWLNEILDSSPHFREELLLKRSDGGQVRHWKIDELQWYWSHEGRVLQILEESAPLLRDKYSAAHFDVLNAGIVHENFGSWPYDRAENARYRNDMFELFSGHDRVVGCEQNKDWAIPFKHFGTNKQPGPYGRRAPFWPIPLWQLAFHDSVMTSWWEHSTYNDPALGHDFSGNQIRPRMLLDLLTGDLPSVCPVGKMYGWKRPGDPEREIFVFRYDLEDPVTQRAIQAAIRVCKFNSTHATDDLIHHEFLSEDGREQQTTFGSGTRVRIGLPDETNKDDRGELEID